MLTRLLEPRRLELRRLEPRLLEPRRLELRLGAERREDFIFLQHARRQDFIQDRIVLGILYILQTKKNNEVKKDKLNS